MWHNSFNLTDKIFISMLTCSCVSAILNLISVYTLEHIAGLPIAVNYLVNILYLATYNVCAIHFFVYVLNVTRNGERTPRTMTVFIGAIAIVLFLLAATPFTGWIISFIFAIIFSAVIQGIWRELLIQNFVISLFPVLVYISLRES